LDKLSFPTALTIATPLGLGGRGNTDDVGTGLIKERIERGIIIIIQKRRAELVG